MSDLKAPWTVEYSEYADTYYVCTADGTVVDVEVDHWVEAAAGAHATAKERDAAARIANLIAAAPEMLEALAGLMRNGCGEFVMDEPGRAPYLRCKHCGAEFAEDVYSHSDDCPFMMAQAVLAKARGESNA